MKSEKVRLFKEGGKKYHNDAKEAGGPPAG